MLSPPLSSTHRLPSTTTLFRFLLCPSFNKNFLEKMKSLEDLEEIISRDCVESQSPLFLHPADVGKRNYTDDELDNFRSRDFKTRLFILNSNIGGKTVSLRTKFSDNHTYTSYLNIIRDILKAFHSTKNFTAAKTNTAELLSKNFQYSPDSQQSMSNYYSWAVTIASGLSNFAQNTSFERDISMVKDDEDEEIARLKMCLLMDLIFSKMSMFRFLVYEEGSNTFRVASCVTKCNKGVKWPLMFALFSFLMQFCLTAYVVAENITEGIEEWQLRNLPLAVLTFIYSSMLIYPSLRDKEQAYDFYGNRPSFLQRIDFFVNHTLSTVLVFSGFVVIMIQQSFIEAVLNSAALLFIPEIDDQLPSLLGYDEKAIIENYIIAESLKKFSTIARLTDKEVTRDYLKSINNAIGVEFSDYYLTNISQQPSLPEVGEIYQPYQVQKGDDFGHKISPSNFITENTLIKSLLWSYTTYNPNGTKPRIGYLKIVTMTDEVIVIERKGYVGENIVTSDVKHKLQGAYVITSFQMSNDVIRLRVCGSKNAADFVKAFEYYSLWEITSSAKRLLQKEAKQMKRNQSGRGFSSKKILKTDSIDSGYLQMC